METIRYLILEFWNQSLLTYRTMLIKSELKRRKAIVNTQYLKNGRDGNRVYDQSECNKDSLVPSIAGTQISTYDCNRREMKRVFDLFDENKDGLICGQELQLFMKRLGFYMSDQKVRDMVGSVDSNCDDHVDFEEFLSLYGSLCKGEKDLIADDSKTQHGSEDDEVEGTLLQAFFVFDENKDGLISAVELQQVLIRLGLPEGKSLIGCQKMIERVDSDGNGKVDFFEFKEMMCSNSLTFCTSAQPGLT